MKFTINTIKDLKIKVKESNDSLLNYYTKNEFKPNNYFEIFTEQSDVPPINQNLSHLMILAFKEHETEFEAGKLLFETLRLSPKQASDIGFWTYHNHFTFYQYISNRWSDLWNQNIESTTPSSYIINHWIQSNSSQAELIDYPISGLWWSFYLTVDESRLDRYELTKILFKNLSLRTKYFGQARFARHKPALLGALEFIKENSLDEKSLEQAGRAIYPFLNLLGGIRPLTYFDKEWFKDKLNTRFGLQIKEGKKLFVRPEENKSKMDKTTPLLFPNIDNEYKNYFCLNSRSGNYIVSNKFDANWDFCLCVDFNIENQFLIHFYQEGKIKKTQLKESLSNKIINRSKPYSNGKCQRLTLLDVKVIKEPVLFGIAYKTKHGTFFKAMDEQNQDNFRIDNSDLNQEGKKVLYIDEPFQTAFKILPYNIKNDLGTLLQYSPTSKGAEITNKYYSEKWEILKVCWPELFDNTIDWV